MRQQRELQRQTQDEEEQYHVDGCIFNCSYAEEQASSEVSSDDGSPRKVRRKGVAQKQLPPKHSPSSRGRKLPNGHSAMRASVSSLLDSEFNESRSL